MKGENWTSTNYAMPKSTNLIGGPYYVIFPQMEIVQRLNDKWKRHDPTGHHPNEHEDRMVRYWKLIKPPKIWNP